MLVKQFRKWFRRKFFYAGGEDLVVAPEGRYGPDGQEVGEDGAGGNNADPNSPAKAGSAPMEHAPYVGAEVMLRGLSKLEYNGMMGRILKHLPEKQRCMELHNQMVCLKRLYKPMILFVLGCGLFD